MEEYLGNANNVDIFEFIKKAITVAATDYPDEFRNNKDKIIETLYSCNKNTQEDDSQKQSIPKASKTACDLPKAKRPTIRIVYRQGVAEVFRIKEVLEGESESVAIICDLLTKLRYMGLSVNTLEVTGIGKTVSVLRKHASKEVGQVASRLLKEWKDMVEEWLKNNNDASCVVHQTLSDEENKAAKGQVIIDQEKISKDMYSKELLIQDKIKRLEQPMEKQNRTITQRANNQTVDVVVKKVVLPAVLKPVVNMVAKTQSGIASHSIKSTESLVIPHHQQSKQIIDAAARMPKRIEKTTEEKLEAVKRKLHQAYEDAENMKKRRTQMLAFHQLPKKGLLPEKTLHIKPRGHQLRRPGNNAIRSVVQAY
uniref:probable mediator of RNA polymerase II transcription subunit 26b n=1 Tax=Erigeron canadensis TaxID=72917 RepID=UPI001CB9B470|nr:probable mediator of RNA polymerase II transcription subunit 26b [Erigeron canadensis]